MHPKPKVVVSKCLGFAKCRYNSQIIEDRFSKALKPFVKFVPVCPEIEIGLGTPRPPVRIAEIDNKKVMHQPETGKKVTKMMTDFSNRFISAQHDVDGFILKNNSPSCGIGGVKTYKGLDKSSGTKRGNGFFGGIVSDRLTGTPVENEDRLRSLDVMDHFLISIYTLARFRRVKAKGTLESLTDFHNLHELLLLAYNKKRYRQCERILANPEDKHSDAVFEQYELELKGILSKKPVRILVISLLLQTFESISKKFSNHSGKRFSLSASTAFEETKRSCCVKSPSILMYLLIFPYLSLLHNRVVISPPIE